MQSVIIGVQESKASSLVSSGKKGQKTVGGVPVRVVPLSRDLARYYRTQTALEVNAEDANTVIRALSNMHDVNRDEVFIEGNDEELLASIIEEMGGEEEPKPGLFSNAAGWTASRFRAGPEDSPERRPVQASAPVARGRRVAQEAGVDTLDLAAFDEPQAPPAAAHDEHNARMLQLLETRFDSIQHALDEGGDVMRDFIFSHGLMAGGDAHKREEALHYPEIGVSLNEAKEAPTLGSVSSSFVMTPNTLSAQYGKMMAIPDEYMEGLSFVKAYDKHLSGTVFTREEATAGPLAEGLSHVSATRVTDPYTLPSTSEPMERYGADMLQAAEASYTGRPTGTHHPTGRPFPLLNREARMETEMARRLSAQKFNRFN